MKYAVIEGGAVANLVLCDDPAIAAERGWVPATLAARIGDLWNGAAFTPNPAQAAAAQAAAAQAALDAALAAEVAADNMLETIAALDGPGYNFFFNQQVPPDNLPALRVAVKRMLRAMALLNRRQARPS